MNRLEFESFGIEDLNEIAKKIIPILGTQRILLFEGEIGAGKTTLIQALCTEIGVEEPVTSPTFAIVNEYLSGGQSVFHIDLYRLEALEEALEIGIEEYLDSGQYCFIEWPDRITALLDEGLPRIRIDIMDDSSRKILFLYDPN